MGEQVDVACHQVRLRLTPERDREEEVGALLLDNGDSTPRRKQEGRTTTRKQCSSGVKYVLHVWCTCLVIAYLVATFNYVVFKGVLFARNLREAVVKSPWQVVVLVCECMYLMGNVMAAITDYLLPPSARPDLTFLEEEEVALIKGSHDWYPTVDILLPCCNEPTDIPMETVKAAMALEYPQERFRVLVLDDGADDELKAFCQALQVESGSSRLMYLRRDKVPGVPHNFKCGNLNYGLKNSDAEFVVLLDADMIVHPSFLMKVLPHIVGEEQVCFVQVPQYYYNLAVGDPLNDACMYSYERLLVHRDSLGAAACIGTGAIFRRSHLDLVGGFQPHSITEDTVTSFALFNLGFKSVYLTEKLQIGLTPWSLEAYINQRKRWGSGAFQQFAKTWKSMLGPKSRLCFMLRVCFIWQTLSYYLSIVNIVFTGTMMVVLAMDLPLISVGTAEDIRRLLINMAVYIILWRITWYSIWLELPNSMQSRNREESQFWWMTPYFFKMVMQSIFNYRSTFFFIPTSTIDKQIKEKTAQGRHLRPHHLLFSYFSCLLKQLHHVHFHIAFVTMCVVLTATKIYLAAEKIKQGDCQTMAQVLGISIFLLTTCAHMLVPVMYILWPTGYKPALRKSLLAYDVDGTPLFNQALSRPKFHWPVIFYELLSIGTFLFWSATLYLTLSKRYITMGLCK